MVLCWTVSLSGHISSSGQRTTMIFGFSLVYTGRVKIAGRTRVCGDRGGRTEVRSYGTKKLCHVA